MSDGLPIIVIAIALVFVALVLMVWRNWGILRPFIARNKKTFLPLFIIGLVLALSAAFFIFDGDILGENTAGIASVIGIVGICLIATSNFTLLRR
jgi:ABC-type iron transport system FetAB permease component